MEFSLLVALQYVVYFISMYFSVFWLIAYFEPEHEEPNTRFETHPLVTIAIPAFNEERTIATTIESALSLDYPRDRLQIIVINDGSTDATRAAIEPYRGVVELIDRENRGKGASLNEAVRAARGEFFVCFDADSQVPPDTLTHLLSKFEDDVAVVLPVMKIKDDRSLNLLEKFQWYEYLVNAFLKRVMGKLDCVHVAPGPFSVYRTELIRAAGYYDEHNITEDLEMTVRMQRLNHRVVQSLDGEVYTNAMPTISAYLRQRNRWFKGGVLTAMQYRDMLFNKRWGDFGLIQLPILILSGVVSITLITTLLYDLLKPVITQVFDLRLVGFDLLTYLRTFVFDFRLIDISGSSVVLLAVMMTLSVFMLWLATHHTRERITRYNPLIAAGYLLVYFFMIAITWSIVTKDLVLGKVQRW